MSKQKLPCSIQNEDGSVTVQLKEPFKYGETQFTELKFKKPKAKHLKGLDINRMSMDDILLLGANLSGEPSPVIGELGMADTFHIVEVIGDFLPAGE